MKVILALILTFSMTTLWAAPKSVKPGAVTGNIKSTRFGTTVEAARVVELVKLMVRPDVQVNLLIKDMGGVTDSTPTQEMFFTLYSKGDVYSTDATFNLGAIYDFKTARKVSDGLFEVLVGGIDLDTSLPKSRLLLIDAKKAINDIISVKCTKIDCPASDEFESTISVNEKQGPYRSE